MYSSDRAPVHCGSVYPGDGVLYDTGEDRAAGNFRFEMRLEV